MCDLDTGDVRCWSSASALPDSSEDIGDDELPSAAPVINLDGHKTIAISAGWSATCALVEVGDVWCWGNGRIGYPNLLSLGNMDFELGNGTPVIPESPLLGGNIGAGEGALHTLAGDTTTCALLDNLTVRC
jgi:hypothetical protein